MTNYYFNEKRAAQAAAIFTRLEKRGNIDKYKLAKLMYYLERETIIRTGQPLFHAELYSIPRGPVASEVNDGIDAIVSKNNRPQNIEEGRHPAWDDHFSRKGEKNLHLTSDPGDDELSVADINLIHEIHEKFKNWSFDELIEYFHDLPEYEETDSRIPIHFTKILRVTGTSEEEIKELEEEYNYYLGVANA
jgi:hypothetical protein